MRVRCYFLFGILLEWSQCSLANVLYSVTDLHFNASAISSTGQVAGDSVIYNNGQITPIGTLPGSDYNLAYAINNAGQVAGTSFGSPGPEAFLYGNGQSIGLGRAGGTDSYGLGLNDAGQVTGWFYGLNGSHAFLYSGGQMLDLGSGQAYGINNAGQVTGYSGAHAFIYSNGVMQDLGTLAGIPFTIGFAINSGGQVTGGSVQPHIAGPAFLYSNGQMISLGSLGGVSSQGNAINDQGEVVGWSDTPDRTSHAFLYSNGKMTDLNDLIDPMLGITLTAAHGINNSGQIVADKYLLTPVVSSVPEPTTLALFAVAALSVWAYSRTCYKRRAIDLCA